MPETLTKLDNLYKTVRASARIVLRVHSRRRAASVSRTKKLNDFQYGRWNSYTLQCGTWLWNRDSEFTK